MGANAKLYDLDFYAWTREPAALLREGRVSDADLDNIVEEIESLGRSERREFGHRLEALLLSLVKWRVQPGLRSHSWGLGVKIERLEAARWLSESPSLRSSLGELMG